MSDKNLSSVDRFNSVQPELLELDHIPNSEVTEIGFGFDSVPSGDVNAILVARSGYANGKVKYIGTDDLADSIGWDNINLRWTVYASNVGIFFHNYSNTPYPPKTGWIPDPGNPDWVVTVVNYYPTTPDPAVFKGQICISTIDGARKYSWVSASINPTDWLPTTAGVSWNATLGKWRKATLSGAEGSEVITWSDL